MKLKDVKEDERGSVYRFEHLVGDDFVKNAFAIRVGDEGTVTSVRLISARYGVAVWEKGRGVVECNAWEAESDVADVSFVSKHFQASFIGSAREREYARAILDDCESACDDQYLLDRLRDFCGAGMDVDFMLSAYGDTPIPLRETSPHQGRPRLTADVTPPPRPRRNPAGSGPRSEPAASRDKKQSGVSREPAAFDSPDGGGSVGHWVQAESNPYETDDERRRKAVRTAIVSLVFAGAAIALTWAVIIAHYFN